MNQLMRRSEAGSVQLGDWFRTYRPNTCQPTKTVIRMRPTPEIQSAARLMAARIRDSAARPSRIVHTLQQGKEGRPEPAQFGSGGPNSVHRLDAGNEILYLRVLGILLVDRLHRVDEGLLVDIVDLAAARPDLL